MAKSNEQLFIKMILCVFILFVALWLFGVTHASQYLICNPQEAVDSYDVTLNGTTENVEAQDLGDNMTRVHYDLEPLADGNYVGSLTAKNDYGDETEPAAFTVIKNEFGISVCHETFCSAILFPQKPTGMGIER